MENKEKILMIITVILLVITISIITINMNKNKAVKTETKTSAKSNSNKKEVKVITYAEFKEKLASGEKMIIDFYADWCSVCNYMAPEVEKAVSNGANVYKVNVDKEIEFANEYAVRVLPTMITFKDGKKVDVILGYKNASQLEEIYKNL